LKAEFEASEAQLRQVEEEKRKTEDELKLLNE
jgi:hypothetical protein